MNRARLEDESFEDYRASQKREGERIKRQLSGKYIHVSKTFDPAGFPRLGVQRIGKFKDER